MSAQGRTLHTQAQQFVLNLLQYFEREEENGGPLILVSAVQEVSTTLSVYILIYHNHEITTCGKRLGYICEDSEKHQVLSRI